MKRNPLKEGMLTTNSAGIGTVTRKHDQNRQATKAAARKDKDGI